MAPKPRSNLVHFYASEITQRWQKVLESIFEVADLLVDAKQKLDPRDWERLMDELPFSDSVARKLLVVGDDPRLRKTRVYKLLPSSYSTIYEITQLKGEELNVALNEGRISTRMHRAQFIAWRNAHRAGEKDTNALNKIPDWVSASMFAAISLYPEGLLPINKALKLKDELTSIWKRYGIYGVDIRYGAQERRVLQKARSELAGKFRTEFQKAVANLNCQLDQDKLDLIESALWQHRAREAGESLPYPPEHPSSIEHKNHPYSLLRGWNYKCLLKETRDRRIITTWTSIKDLEELGQAKCLQLAIGYLETKNFHEEWKLQRTLESIANSKSKDSKFAQHCLKQLVGLQW